MATVQINGNTIKLAMPARHKIMCLRYGSTEKNGVVICAAYLAACWPRAKGRPDLRASEYDVTATGVAMLKALLEDMELPYSEVLEASNVAWEFVTGGAEVDVPAAEASDAADFSEAQGEASPTS